MGALLRLDLRRARSLLLWLSVIAAAYGGFITVFYTNVVDNAQEFERIFEIYPREILLAFGLEGDFAAPGVFLGGYVYSFVWPIVAGLAGIVLATRVAGDADRGFLDVTLVTPVRRVAYLTAAIAVQALVLAVLAVALTGSIMVSDLLITPDLPTANIVLATVPTAAFGAAVAGPATFLAVWLLDRGRAAGVAAGLLILMYLVNVVVALAPEVAGVGVVSLFHYFDIRSLIDTGTFPVADTLVLGLIGLGGWVAAVTLFRGRDLVT